jgi:hypothetical protein
MSRSLHHQIVTGARQIIADPEHWHQGEHAVTRDGRSVDATDARAYRFCAVGAMRRAAHDLGLGHHHLAQPALLAIEEFVYMRHPQLDNCLEQINDYSDHATVVQLLDEFLATSLS